MNETAITGTVRFSDGVEQHVCWNGAGGREVTGFTVMGVDFEPVRECEKVYDGLDTCECSACGQQFPEDPNRYWEPNYCPSCGAKAVGR